MKFAFDLCDSDDLALGAIVVTMNCNQWATYFEKHNYEPLDVRKDENGHLTVHGDPPILGSMSGAQANPSYWYFVSRSNVHILVNGGDVQEPDLIFGIIEDFSGLESLDHIKILDMRRLE